MLLKFCDDVVSEHLYEQIHEADAQYIQRSLRVIPEEVYDWPEFKSYHAVRQTEPEYPFIDLEHEIERPWLVYRLHLSLKVW